MKLGLTMIAAVLFMLQSGGTQAANLKYVRTAKHQDFTRIVFEFKNAAQFTEPVIDGEGKFSVVFPDSTTVLPRQILYKATQIQPVRSIEFVQKKTLLTAGIKLSFPYFRLKAFSLSGPDRIVIDAYSITPPTHEVVPEESLHAKPIAEESEEFEIKKSKAMPEESPAKELTEPEIKEPKAMPEESSAKELTDPEITGPKLIPIKSPAKETGVTFEIKKNTVSDITQKRVTESSQESLNRVPDSTIKTTLGAPGEPANQGQMKQAESLPSTGKNYNLQTYMLVLLNFLTIVIILLLIINLLKKKSGINSEHPGKISDALRTVDESIAAIDAMINREFKKHN